jgi:hypothetical protein
MSSELTRHVGIAAVIIWQTQLLTPLDGASGRCTTKQGLWLVLRARSHSAQAQNISLLR